MYGYVLLCMAMYCYVYGYVLIVMYGYLTVILRGHAVYELIYITNEAVGRVGYYQLIIYLASLRRITVLVNFQAILLISSGETSANCDIFFTDDARNNFFRPPKFQHKQVRSNLTIMAHIMGLGNQSESRKIIILS